MNSVSMRLEDLWLGNPQHEDGEQRKGLQAESLGGRGRVLLGTPWVKECHLPCHTAPSP